MKKTLVKLHKNRGDEEKRSEEEVVAKAFGMKEEEGGRIAAPLERGWENGMDDTGRGKTAIHSVPFQE